MIYGDRKIDGKRIINESPGRGTGDTYYTTEDGRLWHTTDPSDAVPGTGQTVDIPEWDEV